jgi:hypothetical protein
MLRLRQFNIVVYFDFDTDTNTNIDIAMSMLIFMFMHIERVKVNHNLHPTDNMSMTRNIERCCQSGVKNEQLMIQYNQ